MVGDLTGRQEDGPAESGAMDPGVGEGVMGGGGGGGGVY
jgi:hypothetical protein